MISFGVRGRSALLVTALSFVTLCGGRGNAFAQTTPTVRPVVLESFPHDSQAFTQGLLLFEGSFYESTGLEGASSLRRVVPETGRVEQIVELAATEFGEGLALAGDRLIQLTWQNGIAHVYDRASFQEVGSFPYEGEGWGLCYDGQRLVMSDGSGSLFFRDPTTFRLLGEVQVLLDEQPVTRLNELECIGELVYANVWQTDWILRIDPESGRVLTRIDAEGLLTPEQAASADVLNGIAFDSNTGHFYLTGKLWPAVFEVEFPFDPGMPEQPAPSSSGSSARPSTSDSAPPSTSDSARPSSSASVPPGSSGAVPNGAGGSAPEPFASDAGTSQQPASGGQATDDEGSAAPRTPSRGGGCSFSSIGESGCSLWSLSGVLLLLHSLRRSRHTTRR